MNFYSKKQLIELVDSDEISDEEEGFMVGFLSA